MKILAISGHAQNGKDTVAGLIKDSLKADGNRVLVAHYADLVKYVAKTFFNWDGEKDEKGRSLLQYVGTDVVRKQRPDYWVQFVLDIINLFGDNWDYVIIPDTRFPNEIDKLISNGFDVIHIRVVRPNFESPLTEEQQSHPSETALDNVNPDFYIYNEGSMDELKVKINEWIKTNLYRG